MTEPTLAQRVRAERFSPRRSTQVEVADLLDAIDALHQPIGTGLCNECDFLYWPCPTHLLLHPELRPA